MKTLLETAAIFLANDKEFRLPLRFIYSDGRSVSASDGYSLIKFETKKYKEGYYLPIGLQVLLEDSYPDADRALNRLGKGSLEEISLKDGRVEEGKEDYLHYTGRYYDQYFSDKYIKKIKRLGKSVSTFITSNEFDPHITAHLVFSGVFKEEGGTEVPFKGLIAPVRV